MKVLTNLDLQKNQLLNIVVETLSSAPANPVEGQIYYDTVDKTIKQYDGSAWRVVGSTYVLPIASDSALGGIKVGDKLSIDGSGVLSVDLAFETAYNATTNKAATMSDVNAAVSALGTVINIKGVKATYAEIEAIANPSAGDMWLCTADNAEYVYVSGTPSGHWEKFGPNIDLSGYLQISDHAGNVTGESTTTAPTQKAVHDALALKADASTALLKATGTIAANATTTTITITGTVTEIVNVRAYVPKSGGNKEEVIIDIEIDDASSTKTKVIATAGTHADAITIDVYYR